MAFCLIVDDDQLSCEIGAKIIRELGIEIICETDSIKALALCRVRMPDLILLDVNMPKMDGIKFVKELHKLPNAKNAHVIACTGMSDMETVKTLQKEGIAGYIVKPFTAELLQEKVKKLRLLRY